MTGHKTSYSTGRSNFFSLHSVSYSLKLITIIEEITTNRTLSITSYKKLIAHVSKREKGLEKILLYYQLKILKFTMCPIFINNMDIFL